MPATLQPPHVSEFSFALVTNEVEAKKVQTLADRILVTLDRHHGYSRRLEPNMVQQALKVAFKSESCGLPGNKKQILNSLGVASLFTEWEFMEAARQRGDLFGAYFGPAANPTLQKYPQMRVIGKYLTKQVYRGKDKETVRKRISRKIKYRMPGLLFKSQLRQKLLWEALLLIEKNPFLNSKLVFSKVEPIQAALFRRKRRCRSDRSSRESGAPLLTRAQRKILRLASRARKGYQVEEKDFRKLRRKLWRGGMFSRGLRDKPECTLLMTLFNTYCTGFLNFLTIMRTPGTVKKAEKLRKSKPENDRSYAKVAAIYLRHGQVGKAVSLHSELYARRPIFLNAGQVVGKTYVVDEIGKMITNYRKWEQRLSMPPEISGDLL